MVKKILFICKYNRFRSRVAASYFRKMSKNKGIIAESAGIIRGGYPLSAGQVKAAKELGINIEGKPKILSTELLSWADTIVIVADNVPAFLFNDYIYGKILFVWKIKDVDSGNNIKQNKDRIKQIMKKVDELIKKLKKKWQ